VNVQFLQQVSSFQGDVVWSKGRHLIRTGALAEHYQQDMVNPTFSLGTYSFANLRAFMDAYEKGCHQSRIDYAPMDTSIGFDRTLVTYLAKRANLK